MDRFEGMVNVLKVVIATRDFVYPLGGFEEHIYQLLKGFHRRGVECEVLATSLFAKEKGYSEGVVEGARVRRFPVDSFMFGYCNSKGLGEALSDVDCDLLHAHGWGYYAVEEAVKVGRRKGKPVVLTPHGRYHPGRYGVVKMFHNLLVEKTVFGGSHAIALTEHQAEEFRSKGARGVSVVPNGLELGEFGAESGASLLGRLGLDGKRVILGVGRVAWYKGFQDVINALPVMLKLDGDVCFLVVGEDWGAVERLKALANRVGVAEHVFFSGFVPREELVSAYRGAELFVSSAKFEGFGVNVIEAMAAGKPVIATRTGVALDLDGVVLTYDYGDWRGLGELACKVLGDTKYAGELGRRSGEVALGFSWNSVVNKIVALYGQLLTK